MIDIQALGGGCGVDTAALRKVWLTPENKTKNE
jgi:hypothetical protein